MVARGDHPPRHAPGGHYSDPAAINDRGQVVGVSDKYNVEHAFLWQHGKMTDLGAIGNPFDINNSGEIVGTVYVKGAPKHAYLWRHGRMTYLPEPGGYTSQAMLINQKGLIAGVITARNGNQMAVVWAHGKLIRLTVRPGRYTRPIGLNDFGQVIVAADSGNFLWQCGKAINLASADIPATASLAGINGRGQIAGTISIARRAVSHAALWQ